MCAGLKNVQARSSGRPVSSPVLAPTKLVHLRPAFASYVDEPIDDRSAHWVESTADEKWRMVEGSHFRYVSVVHSFPSWSLAARPTIRCLQKMAEDVRIALTTDCSAPGFKPGSSSMPVTFQIVFVLKFRFVLRCALSTLR